MNNLIGKYTEDGGLIIGIVDSFLIERQHTLIYSQNDIIDRDKRWGNWKNQLIAYVYFKNPIKQLSFLEFKESCPYIKDEYLEEEYNELPNHYTISIPIGKLKLKETVDCSLN